MTLRFYAKGHFYFVITIASDFESSSFTLLHNRVSPACKLVIIVVYRPKKGIDQY